MLQTSSSVNVTDPLPRGTLLSLPLRILPPLSRALHAPIPTHIHVRTLRRAVSSLPLRPTITPILPTTRPAPQTRQHNGIIRRQRVQYLQLPRPKDLRHDQPPKRDQARDQHREADCAEGLGDCYRGGDGEALVEEEVEGCAFGEGEEGVGGGQEGAVGEEEDDFGGEVGAEDGTELVVFLD